MQGNINVYETNIKFISEWSLTIMASVYVYKIISNITLKSIQVNNYSGESLLS